MIFISKYWIIFGHISHIDLANSAIPNECEGESESIPEKILAAVLEEADEEQRKIGMRNITIYSYSI